MMGFRFLDEAIAELEEAARYYEAVSMPLSLDLRDEVGRALQYLLEFPKASKPVGQAHRSYKLHRFPYCLVSRIEDAELVIVAIAHTARKPDYWRGRDPGEE
jgi:toxin ParE1/3/4